MTDRKTPDVIIERAVEIWCRMLANPRFDNGDQSDNGGMAMALHVINASHDLDKVNDFGQRLGAFRRVLTERLKWLRDHEGEQTGKRLSYGPEIVRCEYTLSTDYHPEKLLAEAATEAGIPHSAFSWKTDVSFYSPTHVSVKAGYAAQDVNHYPLPSGGWLITRLRGEDMSAIIGAVEDGRLPELTVERPEGRVAA